MIVSKPSDTIRTATTTLADDPHLTFAGLANTVYAVEAVLYLNGPSAADWKFGWSVPAGATMLWGAVGEGSSKWSAGSSTVTPTALNTEADPDTGGAATGVCGRVLKGKVRIDATAGNVTLQWAQNTSNGGNSIVTAGSFLRVDPL